MKKIVPLIAAMLFLCVGVAVRPAQAQDRGALVGSWDIVVHGSGGDYPSWLGVEYSGSRNLVGFFVGQFGSMRPVSQVEFRQGEMAFAVPTQWESGDETIRFSGRLADGRLSGEVHTSTGDTLTWDAVRAPSLKRAVAPTWGKPVDLIGKDLSGWQTRRSEAPTTWIMRDGLLVNAKPGADILTKQKFTDFKLHAEFRYPKGSNSGLYLRGRYEVQIEDGYGQEPDRHGPGAVYGFLIPRVNASKPAGEWQVYDITLIGRTVTVVCNGEVVLDRQRIPGITGGALDSSEGEPGSLLVQGDHGPIEFRKLILTPAK